MKRYRDPTPALLPERLPLPARVLWTIAVIALVVGAVYVSVALK